MIISPKKLYNKYIYVKVDNFLCYMFMNRQNLDTVLELQYINWVAQLNSKQNVALTNKT
jgi:hypothetical protein